MQKFLVVSLFIVSIVASVLAGCYFTQQQAGKGSGKDAVSPIEAKAPALLPPLDTVTPLPRPLPDPQLPGAPLLADTKTNVIQVGLRDTAPLPLAATVVGQMPPQPSFALATVTETVGGKKYQWSCTQTPEIKLLGTALDVAGTYTGDKEPSELLLTPSNGNQTVTKPPKADKDAKTWQAAVTLPFSDSVTLDIRGGPAQPTTGSVKVTAPADSASPAILAPRVVTQSNGKFVAATAVAAAPPAPAAIKVYGDYLRLGIANVEDRDSIRFVLFVKRTGKDYYELNGDPLGLRWVLEDRTNVAVLTLPKFDEGTEGTLFVRKQAGNLHLYTAPVPVIWQKQATLVAPGISRVLQKDGTAVFPGGSTINLRDFKLEVSIPGGVPDGKFVLLQDGSQVGQPLDASGAASTQTIAVSVTAGTDYFFTAFLAQGGVEGPKSDPFKVAVRTTGPRVISVFPLNFAVTPGVNNITVQFQPGQYLDVTSAQTAANYTLTLSSTSPGSGTAPTVKPNPTYNPVTGTVLLQLDGGTPGVYQLTIKGTGAGIKDTFGNALGRDEKSPSGQDYTFEILRPVGSDLPLVAPGISTGTGPFVEYPEFTKPRKVPDGFNPGDKVETRVARLYYYRDAHRVAQIVNRDARSYNRAAVDVRQRLAQDARVTAEQLTQKRQALERAAIQSAQAAREAENNLKQAQNELADAQRAASNAQAEIDQLTPFDTRTDLSPTDADQVKKRLAAARQTLPLATNKVTDLNNRISALQAAAQAARTKEVADREAAQVTAAQEDAAVAEKFRLETAAAHEDPDTYAPGSPNSDDPVKQVSISVIGDAVLQLRGPVKGINIVRRAINQIDQPAGQVRVAIHTVQVNGEHGDRMEQVVGSIQDYIDHSRFLTVQSGLMLRKAVVLVASRKAEEAAAQCPGEGQEARDQRYLYAFFGKDFIDELRALDSEFLHTGNKMLSLHSMDTTSLAAALFVLSLAKNTTRYEILNEFQRMLVDELPPSEERYFEAGGYRGKKHCEKFQLLANNAKFESFMGFFNAEVTGADTINPLQREFIRLAQIFKSQMITEMEYNQRVMERAMIEDRIGDYLAELKKQKQRDEEAAQQLRNSQAAFEKARTQVGGGFNDILFQIDQFNNTSSTEMTQIERQLADLKGAFSGQSTRPVQLTLQEKGTVLLTTTDASGKKIQGTVPLLDNWRFLDSSKYQVPIDQYRDALNRTYQFLAQFTYQNLKEATEFQELETKYLALASATGDVPGQEVEAVKTLSKRLLDHVRVSMIRVRTRAAELVVNLNASEPNLTQVNQEYLALRQIILTYIRSGQYLNLANTTFTRVDEALRGLVAADLAYRQAKKNAEDNRRPLDHKKLLDMLIDEVEDKYIELLEGTRAHTANIDDYIKRLATALEDDFNTQFYFPSFREVRQASRLWDVSLGDIETTNIITNNRMFAKVEPQATLEFDLPKRDILITEAMKDAKALIDDYGALMQDPTFLSLVKLGSGQPTASLAQGASLGNNLERKVLPGLPRLGDENLVTQTGAQPRQLGASLEALIPDPAIYRLETGTGYQISPVIQPDGQSVVFHFNYMYSTNIREPVRPDEKHLGRIKRHFIDTEVQLGNYELREISKYQVALKVARTSRGVPGLEDIPGVGVLFRPLPSAESALQENVVLGQATIYPTLFDLMGLRWAPAVADVDPLGLSNAEFVVRNRRRDLMNRVFDYSSGKVDEFLRVPPDERRTDLYRTQESLPVVHPNGYQGPGLYLKDSTLREGYDPRSAHPETRFAPRTGPNGALPNSGMQGVPLQMFVPEGQPMLPADPLHHSSPIPSSSMAPHGHPGVIYGAQTPVMRLAPAVAVPPGVRPPTVVPTIP